MMLDEKERLLALLDDEQRWCQNVEAKDAAGEPVRFDDAGAVAWDLTGALCVLFGWQRACDLFCQLDRHILGGRRAKGPGRSAPLLAMAALQDFNDDSKTTYQKVVRHIESMPARPGQSVEGQSQRQQS